MPTTKQALRRKVALDLRDLIVVRATGGSTSSIEDEVQLTAYDNSYAGSDILITKSDPLNLGRVGRVLSSVLVTHSLTFTPELPVPIAKGDEAELYNILGNGYHLFDYNLMIETIVDDVRDLYRKHASTVIPVYTLEEPIPIPDDWIGVHTVRVRGMGHTVKRSPYEGGNGWTANRGARTISLWGRSSQMASGNTVELEGFVRHPPLVNDSDLCYLDAEWVRRKVAAALASRRNDRSMDQWAAEWERMAAGREPAVQTPLPPNTVLFYD